jgi:hypothetical protein
MTKPTALALAGLAFLAAPAARAEINLADSLEWMCLDAPLIVRGCATDIKETRGPGAVVYRDVTVQAAEVLKGKVDGKAVTVRLRVIGDDAIGKDWLAGRPLLLFLRPGDPHDDKELGGRWVLREAHQSAIDLRQPKRVFGADFKHVGDTEAILAVARRYAARANDRAAVGAPNVFKAQRGFLRLEVPFDAAIHRDLYAGSACYLNVPAEERFRPLVTARLRSASAHDRAQAADMLANYPGPDTVKALKALLDDPAEDHVVQQGGRLVAVRYPVRAAAYEALRALGERPAAPVLERAPTAEESRRSGRG